VETKGAEVGSKAKKEVRGIKGDSLKERLDI
jgi:hypothetical protein